VNTLDYIGFNIHKKTIQICVKRSDGEVLEELALPANRTSVEDWAKSRIRPWVGAMEATLFTGWVYDQLRPFAQDLQVAHPAMLEAIFAAKKKSDIVDARKLADLLRCDLIPQCYMAPTEIRELRRVLRFRNLLMRQMVRMKNKSAGLLMEAGVVYNAQKLHGKRYFHNLLKSLTDCPESLIHLLRLSRSSVEFFADLERRLLAGLQEQPLLKKRVELLQSIPGVGPMLSLTWALEVGEVERFTRISCALSYCGLTSAHKSSAGKERRGPISKQRNSNLQWVLIEAAKVAPQWNPALKALQDQVRQRGGHANEATLAVARKLVAYLIAVDRNQKRFEVRLPTPQLEMVPEAQASMLENPRTASTST
jgi:transposase